MRKATKFIILSMLMLSITACGKKESRGYVSVEVGDVGKDTSIGEVAQGDSAGRVDSNGKVNNQSSTTVTNTPKKENNFSANTERKIEILGEWDCSNGQKWILDNGYNLTLIDGSETLTGSYSFSYSTDEINLTVWDKKYIAEKEILDDDGNVTGTEEVEKTRQESYHYIVEKYEHSEDYTSAQLSLLNKDTNEKITATLSEIVEFDNSIESATAKKERLDREERQKEMEEETGIIGITPKEYQELVLNQPENYDESNPNNNYSDEEIIDDEE